jgi:CubicO group peptidase (beta-lactamase class C family)
LQCAPKADKNDGSVKTPKGFKEAFRPGTVGSFYWTGAYGTTFFVDPKLELVIIMMIQVPSPANSFYRRAVRYLAYQALISVD